jgi:Fe2+ transport system protein FeoA
MASLAASDQAAISQRQTGADITFRLWKMGLGPEDVFEVIESDGTFRIRVKNEEIEVPKELASQISVQRI